MRTFTVKQWALGFCLAGVALTSQATPIAAAFTNSSSLDFQGDFTYAVTMNYAAGGVSVSDATFTSAFSTAGVGVTYQNYIYNWHPANYGASADDVALGQVMHSIVWTNAMGQGGPALSLTMSNLQVGQTYKAQLLFGEACCDRGFDVFQDGVKIADDFSPFGLAGNNYFGSAALTNVFTATASTVTFGFSGYGGHGDYNPILNAATLERIGEVPEPTSMALLGLALAGLGMTRRKKQNV